MQVLLLVQTAVLSVKTWPVVPDLISLGCIAELQLQGSELQEVGCCQPAIRSAYPATR